MMNDEFVGGDGNVREDAKDKKKGCQILTAFFMKAIKII